MSTGFELMGVTFAALAWSLLGLALPGSLYLLVVTLAGARASTPAFGRGLSGRLALVVPAHNESVGIARTVRNLCTFAARDGGADVVVVADNCKDDTADLGRAAGAQVLERTDKVRRGKGYALDFAFRTLLEQDYAAFIVVDADTVVDDNFLSSMRHHLGANAAVQARYQVANGSESPRTQLMQLALAAFNVLRPRGRARLGWSAGLLGNGFALRRDLLERVPYDATSVVEDLEFHLRLIDSGYTVAFADDTTVRGDMPTTAGMAASQRARWEGGRLRMMREQVPRLIRGVLQGRLRFLEPLAELSLLPLAFHTGLIVACTLLGVAAGSMAAFAAGFASLAVVVLHVLIAVRVARLPASRLLALALVPGYLFWKLKNLRLTAAASRTRSAWVRTSRTEDEERGMQA